MGGSQNCSVRRSLFEDISGTAVTIGAVGTYNITDPAAQDADNAVEDCVVRSVGHEWLGVAGITAFFSRGTRIVHNEVSHVPYTGISIGWGWTIAQDEAWPWMPWAGTRLKPYAHCWTSRRSAMA